MAEEETRIAEEMRLKDEADEQAHLKAEEEAWISEEFRLKAEAKEQTSLKAEDEVHFPEVLRLKAEKEGQARLNSEEEMQLADELRIKVDTGGFYGVGEDRWDRKVDFGVVFDDFGYWDLGVGSLWWWGTLSYCYSHTWTSFISPLSGLPLSMQGWY